MEPDRVSELAAILDRRTALQVQPVVDGDRLAPARVWVCPLGQHTLVTGDMSLALIPSGALPPYRPSVDLLLTTLQLLSAKAGYASIADDTVTDRTAFSHDEQTFWIGVGDRHHRLIFCTVVTHEHSTPTIWSWQCEHAARDGHHSVCAWLVDHADEPAGRR